MRNRVPCLICCILVVAACAKKEEPAVDTTAGAMAAPETAPAAPAALTYAAVAGKWNMRSVPETGDTTPTTYVMTATSDSTGWQLEFPNGPTVPAQVSISGDSIITKSGPYASVRRKGVQVTTDGVLRLEGDRLVGTVVAHYTTSRPDSVLRLRSEGTRAP